MGAASTYIANVTEYNAISTTAVASGGGWLSFDETADSVRARKYSSSRAWVEAEFYKLYLPTNLCIYFVTLFKL